MHIGNINDQFNQEFSIEIFRELKEVKNACLLFIGNEDNKKEISKKLNSLSSLINFVSTNKSENTSNSIYNVTDDDDDEEYDDSPIIEDKSDIPPKSEDSAYRKLSNFGRRD